MVGGRRARVALACAVLSLASIARGADPPKKYTLSLAWKPKRYDCVHVVEKSRSERTLERTFGTEKKRESTVEELELDYIRTIGAVDSGRVMGETRAFSRFLAKNDGVVDRTLESKTLTLIRGHFGKVEPSGQLGPIARELIERWTLDRAPDPDALLTPPDPVSKGEGWHLEAFRALAVLSDPALQGPYVPQEAFQDAVLAQANGRDDGGIEGKITATVTLKLDHGSEAPPAGGTHRVQLTLTGALDGKRPDRIFDVESTFSDTSATGEGTATVVGRFTRHYERSPADQ